MHPQLEILLQIQDLKTQRREIAEVGTGRRVEEEEFNIDTEAAAEELDRKITELEDQLEPEIRARYERLGNARDRAIVPVINGTCYGCFVSIPTAVASDVSGNHDLRHCDNCGRFLYVIGP